MMALVCSFSSSTLSLAISSLQCLKVSTSLAFFASVAAYATAEDYLDTVKKKDAAGLRRETANQVWELARVARWKFAFLQRAYYAALGFLLLAVLARVALHWSGR